MGAKLCPGCHVALPSELSASHYGLATRSDRSAVSGGRGAPIIARGISRKSAALEVVVVLLFATPLIGIWYPSTLLKGTGFWTLYLSDVVRNFAQASLVVYLFSRSGGSIATIGWSSKRAWVDAGLGLTLYLLHEGLWYALLHRLSVQTQLPVAYGSPRYPQGELECIYSAVGIGVSVVVQETTYRGYIVNRLATITRSEFAAVTISSLLFAYSHAGQDLSQVALTFISGLLYAAAFVWRRSLIAPTVAHFIWNIRASFLG